MLTPRRELILPQSRLLVPTRAKRYRPWEDPYPVSIPLEAAVSLASAASGHGTTSAVVSKPTGGWSNGNIMLAGLVADNSTTAPTAPSPWTGINAELNAGSWDAYKIGASEPGSYTFNGPTPGTTNSMAAFVLEYSGQAATPIHKNSGNTGNSKTAAFTGVTTTLTNCRIIAILACAVVGATATFSTPSGGFTSQVSNTGSGGGNNTYIQAWDLTQGAAGAITPGSITITSSAIATNVFWDTYVVAIAPGASTPTSVVFRRTLSETNRVGARQRISW